MGMLKKSKRHIINTQILPEIGSETKRFIYRQIGLNNEHRCTSHLHFFKYVTTSSVQHTVDTSDGDFRALEQNLVVKYQYWKKRTIYLYLNFTLIYGFHKSGRGGKNTGVQATTSSGDDLTTSTMDSVSVKCDIIYVKPDTTQVLFWEDTFFGGPLETYKQWLL